MRLGLHLALFSVGLAIGGAVGIHAPGPRAKSDGAVETRAAVNGTAVGPQSTGESLSLSGGREPPSRFAGDGSANPGTEGLHLENGSNDREARFAYRGLAPSSAAWHEIEPVTPLELYEDSPEDYAALYDLDEATNNAKKRRYKKCIAQILLHPPPDHQYYEAWVTVDLETRTTDNGVEAHIQGVELVDEPYFATSHMGSCLERQLAGYDFPLNAPTDTLRRYRLEFVLSAWWSPQQAGDE